MSQSTNRRSWLWPAVALVAGGAVLANCSPADRTDSTVPDRCQMSPPVLGPQKTDILFVIDNSNSMQEEQAAVATELPAFVQALRDGGGVEQDFRVAVITTSVYQNALIDGGLFFRDYAQFGQAGRLQAVPDGGEHFLEDTDPDLIPKFTRLVQLGVTGSGQETPFEAVRLALTEPLSTTSSDQGGTQGFLRDGARLLVAVVSDEDDCSEDTSQGAPEVFVGQGGTTNWCDSQKAKLTPVQDYFNFLGNLRDGQGARRDVVWAAIAPVGRTNKDVAEDTSTGVLRNVDCPTSFAPGFRQREMASYFDVTLNNLDSICSASYRDSLLRIADIANTASSLDIMNVPDDQGLLLVVTVTRADGSKQLCTVSNGGISFQPGTATWPARIHFLSTCARRPDDLSVVVKLFCAG